jgi:phosphatidylglycerophosphate synthase
MMRALWSTLPNRITTLRFAALPILWLLAGLRETSLLAIGLLLAALTDVIDGFVARRTGTATPLGSRLDSVADHLLTASTVLWLVLLRPDFFVRERVALLAWATLAITVLIVGWIRFRRIGGLHLYSAKVAGTAGYLFAIWLLFAASYPPIAFYLVLGLATVAAAETLIVFLVASRVDEHAGSILTGALSRPRTSGD